MASSSQAGAPARSQWSKIVSASQRALEVGSGFLAEASIVVTHGDAHLENIHEGASRLAKIGAGVTRQLDALADLELHLTTRQQNNLTASNLCKVDLVVASPTSFGSTSRNISNKVWTLP